MKMSNITRKPHLKSNTYSVGLYGVNNDEFNLEQYTRYQNRIKRSNRINTLGVNDYLFALLDSVIIEELVDSNDITYTDLIKDSLLLLLLKKGLPRYDTIQNNLYNYDYDGITYPIYRKIALNEPFLTNNYELRRFVEQRAKFNAINEAKLQLRSLETQFRYLRELQTNTRINPVKYVRAINRNPYMDRNKLLDKTLIRGSLKTSVRRPLMNYYTRTKDTVKHIRNQATYEVKEYANDIASTFGIEKPYPTKTWLWSGKANTRHRFMEGQTVPFNDLFRVVNELTGEKCELRFPRDYLNDPTGANTVNCRCNIQYNKTNDNSKHKKKTTLLW